LAALLITAAHADELPTCTSIKRVTVDPRAIMKVVDGDTFHVFTFDVPNVVKIRVIDAETPERGHAGYEEAKEFTQDWLNRGPFQAVTCGQVTFDRIAYMISRDGENLANALKEAGYWREKH
jgi:endonuclease YncB( thermonuclease family)